MQTNESEALIVESQESGKRLDLFLTSRFPHFSRTYFQKLIASGLVLVNGQQVKKREPLIENDEVEVEFVIQEMACLEPEPIPLKIIYEDEFLIGINKQKGIVVHPGAGNFSHTLVNALLFHFKELMNRKGLRPGIIHRLDKETTGILLIAKDEQTQQKMVEQFASRSVQKEYLALCFGHPTEQVIHTSIGRNPKQRQMMAVVQEGGKEAETKVEVIENRGNLSYVRLLPKTGRTHQLRVHMKFIQSPILGDSLYGIPTINKKFGLEGQLLHAHKLTFTHPVTGIRVELVAPLPTEMKEFLNKNHFS